MFAPQINPGDYAFRNLQECHDIDYAYAGEPNSPLRYNTVTNYKRH